MADNGKGVMSTEATTSTNNVVSPSTASGRRVPPTPRSGNHGNSSTCMQMLQNISSESGDLDLTQRLRAVDGAQQTRPVEAGTPRLVRQPTLSRRSSSKVMPYRGQGFSVDDASQEVDEDAEAARQRRPLVNTGSLRRAQSSTLRRRPTANTRALPFLEQAQDEEEDQEHAEPRFTMPKSRETSPIDVRPGVGSRSDTTEPPDKIPEDQTDEEVADLNAEEDADLSDAESFTLKDRQEAINETHPFGIRIWKPALYKKGRSVEKEAEGDIHSSPGGFVGQWVHLFNLTWTLLFGWWLAVVAGMGGLVCQVFTIAPGCKEYGKILWGLSRYLFYPFGKYVKLVQDEAYAEEDEGDGRSITEYEQWQSGDIEEGRLFFGPRRSLVGRRRADEDSEDESASLLGRHGREERSEARSRTKRRLFGRGNWNLGRVIFFIIFYGLLTPFLFLVSGICWLLVFPIPMGRVTLLLFHHLRRHPLALEFHSDTTDIRRPNAAPSSILVCTYRAAGLKYWKYTVDGTNIILINLLGVVAFVIFDYYVLREYLNIRVPITDNILIFLLALFSIIPLAYFIGQAVASISAQSTMGVGAAINAFFSTVVEVFLYCVALKEGKASLVEGSIIGSIFAGILFLPGISMCFGAIKRKTQRFNVKSAGVTSTMLLFAVIGAFGPTLFYQIYGAHEINCHQCINNDGEPLDRDCRRCFFAQIPAVHDPFYINAIRPYCVFCAALLFLSYVVGLLFTLRTHAATIWNSEIDEKRMEKMESSLHRMEQPQHAHNKRRSIDYGTISAGAQKKSSSTRDIRETQLYKRILGQSLKHFGAVSTTSKVEPKAKLQHRSTADSADDDAYTIDRSTVSTGVISGLNEDDRQALVHQMAEVAATAAAVAARDATETPRKTSHMATTSSTGVTVSRPEVSRLPTLTASQEVAHNPTHEAGGGHDAPNWSRTKSYAVLLTATVAYAVIAEILVSTVDSVLENVDIDEKFLGITLFALVPNTTEFLNAISFAMNGNIALSMEIGSAYALQVFLLQIPALVLFSVIYGQRIDPQDIPDHIFTLIFPQWDMVTVILSIFLLSYMYGEGKSNYFKGSILILSYLVVVVGFHLTSYSSVDMSSYNHQRYMTYNMDMNYKQSVA